jgi:hypothetical protein
MQTNVNAGQIQRLVSRLIVINVPAHCAHNAKKTMIERATGRL